MRTFRSYRARFIYAARFYKHFAPKELRVSIESQIVDIAHKIRITGNDAAHSTVDPKIVPLIQNFFRVLINHVYVLPMQLQRLE
jgi:hypothetical protein